MEISVDSIRDTFAYYLTEENKKALVRELNNFPNGTNYYLNLYQDELLQGDVWTRFQYIRFETGERASIRGIILSNTCDITAENKRDLPGRILFSPIINLSSYVERLEKVGVDNKKIDAKIESIKAQMVTNIFFLPGQKILEGDHVALLDEIHTMPTIVFERDNQKAKVFTLSQIGFYLFLMKLSIHFCRFKENVKRV
jgi:hypothetical protein